MKLRPEYRSCTGQSCSDSGHDILTLIRTRNNLNTRPRIPQSRANPSHFIHPHHLPPISSPPPSSSPHTTPQTSLSARPCSRTSPPEPICHPDTPTSGPRIHPHHLKE